MIAQGAKEILQARMRGRRPDSMVMVSLIGRIETANPVVYASLEHDYDWRWAHGLDVCLWVGDDPAWGAVAKAIAMARPAYLCAWHPAANWGAKVYLMPTPEDLAKAPRLWVQELDFLPWLESQSRDFAQGRTYHRNEFGIPHAEQT
jgi:hypothetical protein